MCLKEEVGFGVIFLLELRLVIFVECFFFKVIWLVSDRIRIEFYVF